MNADNKTFPSPDGRGGVSDTSSQVSFPTKFRFHPLSVGAGCRTAPGPPYPRPNLDVSIP